MELNKYLGNNTKKLLLVFDKEENDFIFIDCSLLQYYGSKKGYNVNNIMEFNRKFHELKEDYYNRLYNKDDETIGVKMSLDEIMELIRKIFELI